MVEETRKKFGKMDDTVSKFFRLLVSYEFLLCVT